MPTPARTAVCLLLALLAACGPRAPEHRVVTAENGAVRLPLAEVADGGVHFFTFHHGGKNVNFLVRTDGAGTLHTHLDACFSCYRYRRGFVVEGPDLLCIACRYTYPIADEEWDFQGACAPIPIHSEITGAHLVVERAVLERAAKYF
jgi:uncharacterized membrane protein